MSGCNDKYDKFQSSDSVSDHFPSVKLRPRANKCLKRSPKKRSPKKRSPIKRSVSGRKQSNTVNKTMSYIRMVRLNSFAAIYSSVRKLPFSYVYQ